MPQGPDFHTAVGDLADSSPTIPPAATTQPGNQLPAVVLPRVGEHVLGLGPHAWRKGPYGDPYSVVHAIEHSERYTGMEA
jgi:hypothetical protein